MENIEISLDVVKGIMPLMEIEISRLEDEVEKASQALEEKRRQYAELSAKVNHSPLPLKNGLKGRMKKGMAEQAIITVLKGNPGGLKMSQIRDKAGLKTTTVYRLLNEKPEVFIEKDGSWILK